MESKIPEVRNWKSNMGNGIVTLSSYRNLLSITPPPPSFLGPSMCKHRKNHPVKSPPPPPPEYKPPSGLYWNELDFLRRTKLYHWKFTVGYKTLIVLLCLFVCLFVYLFVQVATILSGCLGLMAVDLLAHSWWLFLRMTSQRPFQAWRSACPVCMASESPAPGTIVTSPSHFICHLPREWPSLRYPPWFKTYWDPKVHQMGYSSVQVRH